jgi:hypothetical protein
MVFFAHHLAWIGVEERRKIAFCFFDQFRGVLNLIN